MQDIFDKRKGMCIIRCMTNTESPIDAEAENEKGSAELRMELSKLYEGVQPGSDEHSALIHLIAYETNKHGIVEGQQRLAKAQEDLALARSSKMSSADIDVFIELEESERDYVDKKYKASDEIQKIMAFNKGEDYQRMSLRTIDLMSQLEKAYTRDGSEKPFAATALAAREVNERQILNIEPK
jgi:hypothetical protein